MNPANISNIIIGIVIMIIGARNKASKNSTGRDNIINGKNIRNKNPAPRRRNGIANISRITKPPNKKAPMIRKVPNVKNIRVPIKMIANIAKPPNRNIPTKMKGNNIRIAATIALKMSVATIENAISGIDNKNIKKAAPIQNIIVTARKTITAVIKEP